MSSAAAIGRNLGGHRQGHNWRCSCPLGCGYSLSLADGEDDRLLVHCHGGCSFDELLPALVEHSLLDDVDGDDDGEHDVVRRHPEPDPAKIAKAIELYEAGRVYDRIERYLRSRAITITSPVLKFHERAPHRLGGFGPAMLAPIVNIDGEQTGTHMTFLSRLGDGKAEIHRDYQRECRGVIRGGSIRLAPHDPGRELVIGEGVETTMSAMQIFSSPGWASGSAGALQTLELPPEVRRVVVAADNDTSGCGLRNALAAHQRWAAEGRSVRIKSPARPGADFNDVLMGRNVRE
jgi:putative DNA primase/helicase